MRVSKGYGATCLCKMFSDKRWGTLIGFLYSYNSYEETWQHHHYQTTTR